MARSRWSRVPGAGLGKADMKKIMLIYPPIVLSQTEAPAITAPLGIAYIAAVMEDAGFDVEILDAVAEGQDNKVLIGDDEYLWGLPFEDIMKRVSLCNPDVLGVSCQFSVQHSASLKICELAKGFNREIITVSGGAHPSILYEDVLQSPHVDFVIVGEGEYSFRELVTNLKEGRPVEDIDGLAYKKDSSIKCNPKTKWIESLDGLPFPARHLLPMEIYSQTRLGRGWGSGRRSPKANMITSRGCPFKCTFCGIKVVAGKRFRARSDENVLAEIKHLVKDFGIQEIHFEDDNMTLNRQRAARIFDGICQSGFDITWVAPSGIAIWTLDRELLLKMKESGCYRVNLGLESGNDYVLKNIIRKPLQTKMVKGKVELIKELGLEVTGFWVIGNPGETKQNIWETLDFARDLKLDDNQVAIAMPYPGTELYDICKENQYLTIDEKNVLSGDQFTLVRAHIKTEDFTPNEVIAIRDAARFFAVVRRGGVKSIPYRLVEVFQRNGLRGVSVLLEIMKKSLKIY